MDEPDSIQEFCSATLRRYFRLSNELFRPQNTSSNTIKARQKRLYDQKTMLF